MPQKAAQIYSAISSIDTFYNSPNAFTIYIVIFITISGLLKS